MCFGSVCYQQTAVTLETNFRSLMLSLIHHPLQIGLPSYKIRGGTEWHLKTVRLLCITLLCSFIQGNHVSPCLIGFAHFAVMEIIICIESILRYSYLITILVA